jgi:hypothetical protein
MLPLSRCGRWLSRKRFSALALSGGVPRRSKLSGIELLRTLDNPLAGLPPMTRTERLWRPAAKEDNQSNVIGKMTLGRDNLRCSPLSAKFC